MITVRNVAFATEEPPYEIGDWVHKKSGSYWEGRVVGYYSTKQTHEGYCVQLMGMENGPVQIYPRSALNPGASEIGFKFCSVM
ncbi:dihydrofolate reductase protein [Rhizobium phage RHEph22]|uniref:Dihydrofolate reductase protein n=1 Tax=Rhizobium phage RHEph22 TaxID=2836135 RepID=A0AAE7VN23_9CAUD|nr:dihydrofolate reductase protein [Rhizobium phage RHEph22]QXV74745.1 dihydrofolate reductase protein [Rhizobium phage RHEph22]QXV74839.1 dihydrofolate reductase protein [Rhizobium phage RHEph24]